MAISYIKTDEVENISKELTDLANEFDREIDNLFNRFSEVPYITKEWVGTQSSYYFKKIIEDKKQYKDFANKLKEISYKLTTDLYEVQTCIKNNIKYEKGE